VAGYFRHILEEYAIRAYQESTLGESQLRRLLDFETRDEFEDFLVAHNVYRHYTLEDLAQDRRTAQDLSR
jgi:vacuolar-type H+-ATPase subunit C/Vma6